jgi:F-type H+-transporting ATPase subunit c
MKRIFALALLALLMLPAASAFAQIGGAGTPAPTLTADEFISSSIGRGLAILGLGIGLGLIVMGAGRGIGNIGGHAADAIARQPEAGGRIFTTMIISAALIEGVALFAVVAFLIK